MRIYSAIFVAVFCAPLFGMQPGRVKNILNLVSKNTIAFQNHSIRNISVYRIKQIMECGACTPSCKAEKAEYVRWFLEESPVSEDSRFLNRIAACKRVRFKQEAASSYRQNFYNQSQQQNDSLDLESLIHYYRLLKRQLPYEWEDLGNGVAIRHAQYTAIADINAIIRELNERIGD